MAFYFHTQTQTHTHTHTHTHIYIHKMSKKMCWVCTHSCSPYWIICPCHLPGFGDLNDIRFMTVPSEFHNIMKCVTASPFHNSYLSINTSHTHYLCILLFCTISLFQIKMTVLTKIDANGGFNEIAHPVDKITPVVDFISVRHNNIKAFSICYNGNELIRTEISCNNITLDVMLN